jgi:hypothetical protein
MGLQNGGCQWRCQNFCLGGAVGHFGQKSPYILSFCKLKAKTQFYLVHNSLGLGVQMPHCTPSGYATGGRNKQVSDRYSEVVVSSGLIVILKFPKNISISWKRSFISLWSRNIVIEDR